MNILENFSLQSFNTFHIEAKARYFVEITDVADLLEIISDERFMNVDKLVLGGGSNMLFIHDFDGLVIKMNLKGITLEGDHIRAMAGEVWHDFVRYTLDNGWYGLENLSLIPGTVGAAPIQNIGAYGVEAGELIESVQWMSFEDGKIREFAAEKCQFGYRDSFFKRELKGKGVIISVLFRLKKWNNESDELKLDYGAIKTELEARGIMRPTPKDVSDVIIFIRDSKLPNPDIIGNAGSFFKNPAVPNTQFIELRALYPTIPGYPTENPGLTKVAAGWLIEQAGWKGKRIGDAGVHDKQALVLVNHGSATGSDIVNLSKEVQKSVFEKFGIEIEAEVNIL